MSMTHFVLTDNDDCEYEIDLPTVFEVCPRCEGHGSHLHPAIGEHAYSREEFAESFDDEECEAYFRHGGCYDVTCQKCNGARVVAVIDVDRCVTPEQRAAIDHQYNAERNKAAYDAERSAEQRFGA